MHGSKKSMKSLEDIWGLIFTIFSLLPFLAAGFYFGRQDKRILQNETTLVTHEKRITKLEKKDDL